MSARPTRWGEAVNLLTYSVPFTRPRAFSCFGIEHEVFTVRALAEVLFGWIP